MRGLVRLSVPLVALFIVGGTAGIAQADTSDDDSVIGVHDNNLSVQFCHNHFPVNVLGIQVPVQEIAASLGLPIASEDSPSPSDGPDRNCNQSSAGGENEGSAGQRSGDTEGTDSDDDAESANPAPNPGNDDRDNGGLPGPLL